jgi:hypothetical protein
VNRWQTLHCINQLNPFPLIRITLKGITRRGQEKTCKS